MDKPEYRISQSDIQRLCKKDEELKRIIINKNSFLYNLKKATTRVYTLTQKFVFNPLPEKFRYLISINSSYNNTPSEEDWAAIEKDLNFYKSLSIDEVVKYLWRDGRMPEWINVEIDQYDKNFTYINLICCNIFSFSDSIYHKKEGVPPFHVLGPAYPPEWKDSEKSGKFDLNWRRHI